MSPLDALDWKRLQKCDRALLVLIENCMNLDNSFDIEVIMRETVTGDQRKIVRRLISVRIMHPRVVVGSSKLGNIYMLNDLSFVVSILVARRSGIGTIFVKEEESGIVERKKSWYEEFCDFLGKLFGW